MAEGAFRAIAVREGLACEVDSAGTASYHLGSRPDSRAIAVAGAHGVAIGSRLARQIERDDYFRFHHIVALDRANLEAIRTRAPRDATARLSMLFDAVEGRAGEPVPDPYYGKDEDFVRVWGLINLGVEALVARLLVEAANAKA